ncbi:MAG: hypothetical protein ACOY0T_38505 [Myxococcota bacterium]
MGNVWNAETKGTLTLLVALYGCSARVELADGNGGQAGSTGQGGATGGTTAAGTGGAKGGTTASGGRANGLGGAPSHGGAASGGTTGMGGAGKGGSGNAGASMGGTEMGGAPATCEPGAHQTCNDDPIISSLRGTCLPSGMCECKAEFEINPLTGKCRLPGAPSCTQLNRVEIDRTVLGEKLLLEVERLGDKFAIMGLDPLSPTAITLAEANWNGLVDNTSFPLEVKTQLGMTAVRDDSEQSQLLFVDRAMRISNPEFEDIRARAFRAGSTLPINETVLLTDVPGDRLTLTQFRSSRDGKRGLLSYGSIRTNTYALRYTLVGAHALAFNTEEEGQLESTASAWSCYDVQPTDNAGALVFIESAGDSSQSLRVVELAATGDRLLDRSAALLTLPETSLPAYCPMHAETATGFHVLWSSPKGENLVVFVPRDAAEQPVSQRFWTILEAKAFGALSDGYVFVRSLGDRAALERTNRFGGAMGVGVLLTAPVQSPQILDVSGHSVFMSYVSDTKLVLSEFDCP